MQEIHLSGLHCRFRFCHLFEVYRKEERFAQGLRPAGLHHLSVVFHLFEVCRWLTFLCYGVYVWEYLWHKKRQASKPAVFGMGSLDDASSVAVFELLAAAAGAWVVASGHLVFDDGRVSPCFGSLACVLSCGGGLCGVAEIVFTFGVSL